MITSAFSTLDASARVPAGERAVVLHGGGSAGNAWEIGVIAGLIDAGLALTAADLIVGTSAGATAAAQILGERPSTLYAAIVDQRPASVLPPSGAGQAAPIPAVDYVEQTNRIIASAVDPADMRRRIGAAALGLDADPTGTRQVRWRATVAGRLPVHTWPGRPLLITAVDAETGTPVVFDRDSGIELVDAVAASTSNGFGVPPYAIGTHHYIDGGYRRNENADLAAGYRRILVLSPFGGRSRHPHEWRMHLAAQIDELHASGSQVATVFPDEAARAAFGADMMDVTRRGPSARAGYGQGRARAGDLEAFWRAEP